MILSSFTRSLAILGVLAVSAVSRLGATTVLDTYSNATNFTFTGSTPRTYMGDGFTNSMLTPTSQFVVTDLSVFVVSATAQTYTDVLARIQFYNSYDPNAASVFSNPAGSLLTIDLGTQTFAANTIYRFDLTLSNTQSFTLTGNNLGFVQNFQGGIAGATPTDTTNLTSLITYNTTNSGFAAGQVTTGVSPTFGYYRNASGRTDFNFANTDSRSLTTTGANYQAIGIIVNGALSSVPEPSTWAMMATGGISLVAMLRVRRRMS